MADADFPYDISDHARQTIEERSIQLDWIVRTLENPAMTEPDQLDPDATHALAPIPEFGDRVLRVIYNPTVSPWRIITAYFDRRMKGRL